MNLAVAVNDASIEAVKATHASVTHDMNERRGMAPLLGAEPGAGFAAVALAGPAGAAEGVLDDFAGAGSRESSLLIGISQELRISRLKLLQCFQ
jgi:hypothetical protein